MVLLGADAVCRDGAVINKTGSLAAALGARRAGVPVYVLADRFKVEPDRTGIEMGLERMAGEEIWRERPALCLNLYFEPVPADLINAIVTEAGPFAPGSLGPLMEEMAALRRALDQP
jgi:translation initiation factor 2B subunit (eIF-2B alpha/beta/delta family)